MDHKDSVASLQTYQVGTHFEAATELVFMAPSDSRYTQAGFNLFSVQVCLAQWGQHLQLDAELVNMGQVKNLKIDLLGCIRVTWR